MPLEKVGLSLRRYSGQILLPVEVFGLGQMRSFLGAGQCAK